MKKLITLLSLLLLSCNQSPKTGKDNYTFGNKEFERQTVQVNIVTYKTQQEFDIVIAKLKLPKDTVAFTTLREPYDTCTIHMIDPSVRYEPEYVGHEFLHCVYGQWHTDNNSTG